MMAQLLHVEVANIFFCTNMIMNTKNKSTLICDARQVIGNPRRSSDAVIAGEWSFGHVGMSRGLANVATILYKIRTKLRV